MEQLRIDPDKPGGRSPKRATRCSTAPTIASFTIVGEGKSGRGDFDITWEGVIPRLMRRFRDTSRGDEELVRPVHGQHACTSATDRDCAPRAPRCGWSDSILAVSRLTVDDARAFFDGLKLTGADKEIAVEVLKEIRSRLDFLAPSGSAISPSTAPDRRSRAANPSGSGSPARWGPNSPA